MLRVYVRKTKGPPEESASETGPVVVHKSASAGLELTGEQP